MHAISAALELHIDDLSPFAPCAPSFLLRLWVGKVFRITNHLNLQIRTRNFNTYKTFFVTFLRFFPSLGLYLPYTYRGTRNKYPAQFLFHSTSTANANPTYFSSTAANICHNSIFQQDCTQQKLSLLQENSQVLNFFFTNHYFQIDRKSLNLHPTPILSTQLGKTNLLYTIIQLPP